MRRGTDAFVKRPHSLALTLTLCTGAVPRISAAAARLPEVVLSRRCSKFKAFVLRRAERHRYATPKNEFFYRRMTSGVKFVHARIAAGNGDLSTVEAWLSQGGDINSDRNDLGRSNTLLSAAIVGSQTQICEYLVARGARCGKVDVYRLLNEILANPSYLDVARLLIEHGADPAMGGGTGGWGAPHKLAVLVGRNDTYLQGQARSRCPALIRFLVEKGAPVDLRVTGGGGRFSVGTTPLMAAAYYSAPVVFLRELLRHGADLFAMNEDGDDALLRLLRRHRGIRLVAPVQNVQGRRAAHGDAEDGAHVPRRRLHAFLRAQHVHLGPKVLWRRPFRYFHRPHAPLVRCARPVHAAGVGLP